MSRFLRLVSVLLAGSLVLAARSTPFAQDSATIETHDNLRPAGRQSANELRLSLRAGLGRWSPTRSSSSSLDVAAFGEDGAALQIPSPLVRVRQGTVVRATVRNTLASSLTIHGFCDRPGTCPPLVIAAGASRDIAFTLGAPGTYFYWGTTSGAEIVDDRTPVETQLGGAIVVDPPDAVAVDRVFVISIWNGAAAWNVINGRSWPDTERLTHAVGDVVRWRFVNLSQVAHGMHLHGFYFRVDSVGNVARDTIYAESDRRLGVTEQIPPGRSMTMRWVPERAGNWLFHCHMLIHMMDTKAEHAHPAVAGDGDVSAGMSGLVLGVKVSGPAEASPASDVTRRRIQMRIDPDTRDGSTSRYRVSVEGTRQTLPRLGDGSVPGPVMVLTRGEPVAVEVANHLSEPTAIHWHGIELESYDDGVAGYGGKAGSVTPAIAPGGAFTARFTPPRAGTFIYHTHWHNAGQLAGGIYGALIVLEPGQMFDSVTDHIVVIGLDGTYRELPDEPFAVNGQKPPKPVELKADVTHRFRLINITADNVALTVQLIARFDPVEWTLVSKDGATTPVAQRVLRPARQLVTVGETYDFEIAPPVLNAGPLWMELRRGSGEMVMQWRVVKVR